MQIEVKRKLEMIHQIKQMKANIKAHVNVIRIKGQTSVQDKLLEDVEFTERELVDSNTEQLLWKLKKAWYESVMQASACRI